MGELRQKKEEARQKDGELRQKKEEARQKDEELQRSREETEEMKRCWGQTQKEKFDLEITVRSLRKELEEVRAQSVASESSWRREMKAMQAGMAEAIQQEVRAQLLLQQKQEQGQRPSSTPSSHKPGLFQ
jgi:hypothetical protein